MIKNVEFEHRVRDMVQVFLRTKVKHMATESQEHAARVMMTCVNQLTTLPPLTYIHTYYITRNDVPFVWIYVITGVFDKLSLGILSRTRCPT